MSFLSSWLSGITNNDDSSYSSVPESNISVLHDDKSFQKNQTQTRRSSFLSSGGSNGLNAQEVKDTSGGYGQSTQNGSNTGPSINHNGSTPNTQTESSPNTHNGSPPNTHNVSNQKGPSNFFEEETSLAMLASSLGSYLSSFAISQESSESNKNSNKVNTSYRTTTSAASTLSFLISGDPMSQQYSNEFLSFIKAVGGISNKKVS